MGTSSTAFREPQSIVLHLVARRSLSFSLALITLVAGALLADLIAAPLAAANGSARTESPFWLVDAAGDVTAFGTAGDYGDLKGVPLNQPIVGMTPTATAKGYWLVATDGGIFAYGDAPFYGSTGNIRLNKPIVGMTPTTGNKGYWMVATDGGIFAYGDAQFYGSTGSIRLNKPVVGMAATPSGHGYWLVASDGGIFAYGDAQFYGSTGSIRLNRPIVSMASTPSGHGYWLVASDGGIFAYGDAKFYGSPGGGADDTYQRLIPSTDGKGYWLVRNGGDFFAYGTVPTGNGLASTHPAVALRYDSLTPGDVAAHQALSQLGKPYVWGATGPAAYDCSGLTSSSWRTAGVTIPRVANDQYTFGTRVALDQLRPGDLLFWGTDQSDDRSIDHVGMYIGGGWAVNAGGTGTGVNIRNVPATSGWLWPYGVRPKS